MMGTHRLGYVVATHPEDHSVDLVMCDDGSRLIGIQVLSKNGSTRTGSVDMPAVPAKANKWDITQATGQDQKAVVAYVGRNPVVIGFLIPQINQMLFNDPLLAFSRHQSDVIKAIDGDGNIDIRHPGGLRIRIGETPEHADFSGKNTDANFAVDRNQSRKPFIRVSMPGDSMVLTVTPDGVVTMTSAGPVTVTAPMVTLNAPETLITGHLTVMGDAEIEGVSSRNHVHDGVRAGPDTSGHPVLGS
jgi:hypothetical protein